MGIRKGSRRRWLWVLAVGLFGVGVLAFTLFLPSVQRRLVMGLFPAEPGTSLEFKDLRVGIRRLYVRDLRLTWRGLRVSIGEADATYRIIGLVTSRTARVDRLRVRGLVVDLRAIEPAAPQPAPAGEPYRFEGLLPLAHLPFRAILSEVGIGLELLTSTPNGGTARLRMDLSGRGIEPGATGELSSEVGLRLERPGASRDVLASKGSLRVHQTEEGVLDILQYQGEGRPGDPGIFEGAGLAVQAAADLSATDETYRIVLSTTGTAAREVIAVEAARRAADGRVAGSWKARLDAGQADPFLGDFAPPEFALSGAGSFEIDPAARSAATEARFEASASEWGRLHPELAAVGPLQIDAEVSADLAGPSLTVRSLSARMAPAGAAPVLEVGVDQPFRVDRASRRIEASRWGAPLAHLRLQGVPVTWWSGSGTRVRPLAGTVQGSLELTAEDPHRLRLKSTAPLALAGVKLRTAERDLGPVAARAELDATLSPEAIHASLAGCRVQFADTSRLAFDGSLAMPRDGRFVATLRGDLALHAAALSRIIPQVEFVRARGTFGFDFPASTLSLVDAAVSVDDVRKRRLLEGSVSTVRPLVLDLHDFSPRWSEFEPDELRLRVDGFPAAWAGRYLPQIRIDSGTLHGRLGATVSPDRVVRIAADAPFELRDASLFWGDLQVLSAAHLEVSPSITLSRQLIRVELDPIKFADEAGNRFQGIVRVRSHPDRLADAGFTADLRAFTPSLTRRIGNLGEFEFHAVGSFDSAARALRVSSASFDCKDPDGRSYLGGASLQPFSVSVEKFEVAPEGKSSDLFRAKFIPLEIEKLFPEALGFDLTGPLPSGEALISARDGGLLLHLPRPLEFGPVTVTRHGAPFLDRVRFTLLPEVAYSATGVRSRETLVEISSAGKPIATIATRGVFDIVGLQPERAIDTSVEVFLPALFAQPAGLGLPQFDRGKLAVSWHATLGASRRTDLQIALSDAARRDGLTAPDFEARVELVEEAKGSFRIEAPLRLTAPGRTSDLTARGRLRVEKQGNTLDLSIDSNRIVLEDFARLASAFLPPGAQAETESRPADTRGTQARTLLSRFGPRDGKAFWHRLRGTVPINLRSIEFDRYALEGAHATITSTPGRLAIDEIGATFLGASLGGRAAVTFDGTGAAPLYGVEAALKVADVDLGRMFTTVDPSRKPTLEGRFRLDAGIRGSGPDPVVALIESRGEVLAEGSGGVFRGLVPGAKTASRLVRAAGALTFSKEMRATGRLIGQLQELQVKEARVRLERDPARGLLLDALDVRSSNLVVHGTGSVRRERGLPFVERDLRLDVSLAASGDAAIVFEGLGLLGAEPDVQGLRRVTSPVSVGGTLGAPDASALWTTLDEAAASAKGSFGWALRKAMASVKPDRPTP